MRSFHWFHLYFIPKVRKYLDSKGLPSKILFILDNALSHTEPCEFNTVFYLPPNTTSLIQLLDQGVMRTFKAHYSQYSVGGTVNTMEQNLDRKNNVKVRKDYTIENFVVVLQKIWADRQPETMNSCWRKLCPDVVHDFTGLLQSRSRKLWRACECGQKKGGEEVKSFTIWILEKFKSQ